MKHLFNYVHYLTRVWFPLSLLFIVIGIESVLTFTLPVAYKIVYDKLIPTFDKPLLLSLTVFILVTFFLISLNNLLVEIISTHLRGKLISDVRNTLSGELLSYRFSFFGIWETGAVVQRLIPEIETVATTITMTARASAYLLQLLLLLVVALLFSPVFFLICTIAITFYIIWHSCIKRPITHHTTRVQGRHEELYNFFFEHLHTIKLVKLFNIYSHSIDLLESRLRSIKKHSLANAFFRSLLTISTRILDLALLAVVIYSMYRIMSGSMPIGFYLVFMTMLTRLVGPVNFIIDTSGHLQSGSVAAMRIDELRNCEFESSGKNTLSEIHQSITFRNVQFNYTGDSPVLNGIDFTIQPGDSVAFVGSSGSGKSTIIQLLLRLYDPAAGFILIDGVPLQSYDLSTLRDMTGVVSQDIFLFNDTIRSNIDPKGRLSDREIADLLRQADLGEFSSRLEYTVGEGGCNCSGGERQRLSIARLLARKPQVIIMDEATSSLDPRTEHSIMKNIHYLKSMNPRLIYIMITHRIQHLADMDRVLFIENGTIGASGTHEELSARNTRYRNNLKTLNTVESL